MNRRGQEAERIHSLRVRVDEDLEGHPRIDSYLAGRIGLFTRSQVKRRLKKALVNGREVKLNRQLRPGDLLEIQYIEPPPLRLTPEPINLDILYEDANLIVVDKPQGMVVHPGSGNRSGTLVNALLHHCKGLKRSFPDEPVRPGIVHRLDKDTSGVLIAAKNTGTHAFLAEQFRTGKASKTYLAVIKGSPGQPSGRIESLIGRDPHHRQRFTTGLKNGKRAVTDYRVIKSFPEASLVLLRPRTGRTHQLRVHMASLGCPILGDPIYGRKARGSLLLHAYKLSILLPGEEQPRSFKAPLPKRFRSFLRTRNPLD